MMISICDSADEWALLERVSSLCGVRGHLFDVGQMIVEQLQPYVDVVRVGGDGAVTAWKGQSQHCIVLTASIDESGFLVERVDDRGRIYFLPVGQVDASLMLGRRLVVHTQGGQHTGVVGCDGVFDGAMASLFVDTGAVAADDLPDVRIGDPITFAAQTQRLYNRQLSAKALTSRAPMCALIQAAMQLYGKQLRCRVVFHFSAGGGCGAVTGRVVTEPSGHVVTVNTVSDVSAHGRRLRLGDGPVLWRGVGMCETVFERISLAALEHNIPSQWAVMGDTTLPHEGVSVGAGGGNGTGGETGGGGTTGGWAGAQVSIPCRYPRRPYAVVSLDDLTYTSQLLAQHVLSDDVMVAEASDTDHG